VTGVVGVETKKKGTVWSPFFWSRTASPSSGAGGHPPRSLGHAVRLDALRADTNPLDLAVDDSTDTLEIRIPAPISFIVRVAHMVSKHRSLATDIAHSSHDLSTAFGITEFAKH
jgi:hypothetical protein